MKPLTPGVYTITNTRRGKVYVGQSQEVENRLREHRRLLEQGAHPNRELQVDWASDGAAAFVFVLVEAVDMRTHAWGPLYAAERRALGRAMTDGPIYNRIRQRKHVHRD